MPVADIAYLVYDHVDLEQAERFYQDFGLKVAYRTETEIGFRPSLARGYCYVVRKADKPALVAIGMRMTSAEALEQASKFPEASDIEPIDRPGGGQRVRLKSPDGLPFELVHGIEALPALDHRKALNINTGNNKVRHGEYQRPQLEPSPVLRIGHVALLTKDFKANFEWMKSRLGMQPTDIIFDGSHDNKVGAFLHSAGCPEAWTDHHTLALFPSDTPRVHHCSFEVEDIDAEFLGNKWMHKQGWKPVWGIGRHHFGSQIFDYWHDPAGNVVEHFTDSDLVQPGTPETYHQANENSLYVWGPSIETHDFVEVAAKHG